MADRGCVLRRGHTIAEASGEDGLEAVGLPARLAVLAGMADILNGFEACALANLECLDRFSDLDNDTGAFMTCTFGAHFGHLGYIPVVQHEVDVAQADAGSIELDQHILRTFRRTCCQQSVLSPHLLQALASEYIPISGTGTFSTST